MSEIASQVIERGGRPGVPGFRLDPQSQQIIGLGIQFNSDPQNIVRTKMLATHAKNLGVEFDDNAVDQFLQAYVNGRLNSADVQEILDDASRRRAVLL